MVEYIEPEPVYYHMTSKEALQKMRSSGMIHKPVYVSEKRSRRFLRRGILLRLNLEGLDMDLDFHPDAAEGWWKVHEDIPISRIESIEVIS